MSDVKTLGVPHQIDKYNRNLIFNINVMDKAVDKFGKLDNVFNAANDIKTTVWFAVEMFNQDAEIQTEDGNNVPIIDEAYLKRRVDGMGGLRDLQKSITDAILKGLSKESVQQVEELGKNLLAMQSQANQATT